MALEMKDGKITGSSDVAKAGLALGIVGTSLAVLSGLGNGAKRNFNNAFGWGWGVEPVPPCPPPFAPGYGPGVGFGGYGNGNGYAVENSRIATAVAERKQSEIAALESKISKLESMRYTDYVGIDLYREIIAQSNAEDAKIAALQAQTFGYVLDLDKKTALNEQAARLNREYDTAARDYMFTILNNKIDCCCEKAAMQMDFNKQIAELSDAAIIGYTNSTFLPGVLKLPASNICPAVQLAQTVS